MTRFGRLFLGIVFFVTGVYGMTCSVAQAWLPLEAFLPEPRITAIILGALTSFGIAVLAVYIILSAVFPLGGIVKDTKGPTP